MNNKEKNSQGNLFIFVSALVLPSRFGHVPVPASPVVPWGLSQFEILGTPESLRDPGF